MKQIIKTDLYRYKQHTSILKGLLIPGFRYTYFLRKASQYKKLSVLGLLYRFIHRRLGYKFGFQIPPNTKIGKGLFLGHFGTVVINEQVTIGNYCNIAHTVTIGRASRGKLQGSPTIGNQVWIGTGAVIVGKISIGSDVIIAPNAYVNMNIPEHSIVIGNPAKIIKKDNPTKGYINHIL
ncbi:serine acetyltransferase [Aquimarina sp. ERC-38]|uniref:serine O-acetyltransferase n=1 Tax=Aquimarina sp. ERC-38 TaxID=2949996 RepID=UPI0022473546|nr:serine acetyltransferase [Aquimarina sp. ERC-38]UZO80235.1 serine acetyltransferase [Aquimarina sp. ERC-38]